MGVNNAQKITFFSEMCYTSIKQLNEYAILGIKCEAENVLEQAKKRSRNI